MSTVKACEQSVVEAALTASPEAALRAFALHPLVGSLGAARALVRASADPGHATSSNARHIRAYRPS